MSDAAKKRWLIKDQDGRVRGPFYTDEILKRITRGELSGEEKIALYPSTNWMPISNDPNFYDQLLDSLDREHMNADDETSVGIDLESESSKDDRFDDFIEKKPEKTKTKPTSSTSRATRTESSKDKKKSRGEEEVILDEPVQKSSAEKVSSRQDRSGKDAGKKDDVIELKKMKSVLRRQKAKKVSRPFLLLVVAILGVALYLITQSSPAGDRIHLLAPRSGQAAISAEVVKSKTQAGLAEYVKDSFSSYMRAQTELVQVLEGDPKNAGVIALTCLTYLELWPYAFQDSDDLQTLSTVAQMASRLDPAGVEAATCRTVDLFVRGRYVDAKGVTEMILDTFARENKPPIAFYYFKARLFELAKDYRAAISYAQSAQQLWKQWLRVYALEASLLEKSGDYNAAANKYRAILTINSNHRVARIELGLLEYLHLNNFEEGKKQLEIAMGPQAEKAPREIEARGFLGLAEIALKMQNVPQALEYAQKSYLLNSTPGRAKDIILQLGGADKLKESKLLDVQLMYEGDQLVREGDCNAAQAHYKSAYEINHKNGMAAMKAAECLWALSLSTDAISWLDKAIRGDPKLIDAYILLGDYYTQRYNYSAAAQILGKAKALFPTSYKVYRGFALAEWRRKNSAGAVNFAQKAIQLYGADVESYVILARALVDKGDYAKGFEAASKAIEIDMNNQQAQVIYAQALAGVRGMSVGVDYLNRLVNTYPTVTEYRLALGDLYMRDQRFSAAEQIFEQVIRIEDKPKRAYMALGKALFEQKRYDDAGKAYFKAATLDPSDVEPLFLVGQLYLHTKQASEARQQFQRVLRVNRDYPLVNYYIGRAAILGDSPDEALEQANLEKAKNPNLADPYLLAAEAYTLMKQYHACAGEYLQAVRLRPANSDIYVKMARCYRMSGNLDAAVSMINQASHQESANAEAWKEQGAIYEVRQENIKAIEAYSQYLVLAPNAPDAAQVRARIEALSR